MLNPAQEELHGPLCLGGWAPHPASLPSVFSFSSSFFSVSTAKLQPRNVLLPAAQLCKSKTKGPVKGGRLTIHDRAAGQPGPQCEECLKDTVPTGDWRRCTVRQPEVGFGDTVLSYWDAGNMVERERKDVGWYVLPFRPTGSV